MVKKLIGVVSYFFDMSMSAMVKLSDTALLGDQLHFYGASTDFKQKLEKMEKNQGEISVAKAGENVGIKVIQQVREGDKVYKIDEF